MIKTKISIVTPACLKEQRRKIINAITLIDGLLRALDEGIPEYVIPDLNEAMKG